SASHSARVGSGPSVVAGPAFTVRSTELVAPESSAVNRSAYNPGAGNVAVVLVVAASAKIAFAGPATVVQRKFKAAWAPSSVALAISRSELPRFVKATG